MCTLDFDMEQVFRRRFRSGIFFLTPSDSFVMERKGHVYALPKGTTEQQINELMARSLRAKRNLIYDDVRTHEILTEPDAG